MMQSPHPIFRLLLTAACFGLLCGLGESIVYALLSVVPDGFGWKNDLLPEILWIAPVVNLLWFLGVGAIVALLSRVGPRIRHDLYGYAVFGWLASYGLLATLGKLRQSACILLALGLATQFCRYARSRPPATPLFLGRSLAALVVTIVGINLAGMVFREPEAVSAGARMRPVSSQAPNVLLIVLDTLRADRLSAYGYARPTTPNIDRLAREGVLFENAFATASWTLPSHASLMTGRYPYEHRAGSGPLDTRYPTLAAHLFAKGYATGGFVANLFYCSVRTGLARGFATYKDHFSTYGDMIWRTFYGKMLLDRLPRLGYYDIPGRKRATRVNEEFLQWLEANHNTSFFAFLNYTEVHDPYIPPSPYATKFSAHPNRGKYINSLLFPRDFTGGRLLPREIIQDEMDGYDNSLASLDAELGSLFTQLAALGLLDNTVVIITSDHGESFGNHALFGHGNSLYRELLHVPLIIRYPGKIPVGLRVSETVSLQAIPATVMELLGFASEALFPGQSLTVFWAKDHPNVSSQINQPFAFAEALQGIVHNPTYPLGRRSIMKSLTTTQWHLILYEEGKVELFRVDQDVQEAHNLAPTPGGSAVIEALGRRMAALMTPQDWTIFGPLITLGSTRVEERK